MLSRRTVLGSLGLLGVGLVAAVGAVAWAGPGARHGMMKRVATAMIDEALEPANVTPEQRIKIYAVRDRVFATLEARHQGRRAHMEEALSLFEADTVDSARLTAFRAQREAEHRQMADTITQAITEVHDVLTPVQRKAVADWIRAHRGGHWH
jgi:protein CpxP